MARPRRKRRSGADTAGLILRGVLGGTFLAHGVKHARSLEGTAGWFDSIGFEQPALQARASAVVEAGAGAALLAGAATPLSAAAVVGTMSVAYKAVHAPNGFFITEQGWEYNGVLAAAAVALSALGAGPFSLDRALGCDEVGTPGRRAALTAALGVGGAAAQLAAFWRRPATS